MAAQCGVQRHFLEEIEKTEERRGNRSSGASQREGRHTKRLASARQGHRGVGAAEPECCDELGTPGPGCESAWGLPGPIRGTSWGQQAAGVLAAAGPPAKVIATPLYPPWPPRGAQRTAVLRGLLCTASAVPGTAELSPPEATLPPEPLGTLQKTLSSARRVVTASEAPVEEEG